jgi:hypothetical protein
MRSKIRQSFNKDLGNKKIKKLNQDQSNKTIENYQRKKKIPEEAPQHW